MKKFSLALISVLFAGSVSLAVIAPAQAASCVVIKNVLGKNYQTAQDIWRAQGFVVLPATDGMGWGRMAWIDRNWKVIGQYPGAGKCIKKGSGVRATIIKYTD